MIGKIYRRGGIEDFDYLKSTLIDLSTEPMKSRVIKDFRGAIVNDTREMAMDIRDLWNLLFDKQTFTMKCVPKLDFEHYEFDQRQGLRVTGKIDERRIGFWGIPRTSVYNINVELEQIPESRKLKVLEQTLSHLKPAVEKAAFDFKRDCLKRGINPHSSRVHSFNDTLAQAYVLAVPGRTEQERYNLAYLTFSSHAFDDAIETFPDLETGLPYKAQNLRDRILNLNANETTQCLIDSIISGALIQQARTKQEQEKRILEYRAKILARVKDPKLKKDLEELHPALLAQSAHVGMTGLFGLEEVVSNVEDLGALYDVYYGPALYSHDADEERKHEGSRILYGKDLCKKNFLGLRTGELKETELIKMIDVFDRNLSRIQDSRENEHYTQRRLVHEAFKNSLPEIIREKYEQSLNLSGI